MQVAVLGTGTVGATLAPRLAELGHVVRLGTRDPAATRAREGWSELPGVELCTFAEATAGADLVVHAGNGASALDLLAQAGDLAGVVLLDISNPLDFSAGFPPTLSVKDTDSLGEQVQRAFPEARVVKSLNTLTAELMAHPDLLPEPTSVFVSGDDADAKRLVTGVLAELGHRDVIDLGGIETSRGVEMWLPLWLRLMGSLGTAEFNLKVVRAT
ncbi:NADPH-dependent F420 reductase [Nocardioides ganghwensis]|jgi:predicted dinucleotide-binding enzyme|uniref:NADP oxidoreductase n=1 Tax=Nocardioides ganghwensis TaxID=252230 RepID=A0A4Q2S907_9ACTN|nr:NAD(P)-binding domain-containing protein [Nocardioides ganghwensis]MBD3948093.1 NAD(P)-binding domain-containing protein [Nocardioides ganghwensis]RYB97299.1 NADP oxidoreductase [Nocardioides ganghwensis]